MIPINNLLHVRTRSRFASRAIRLVYSFQRSLVPARSRADLLAASSLFVTSLVYYLSTVTIGWRDPIADASRIPPDPDRPHRLLVAAQRGPWLIYETPVLGPPGRSPFEFPLYQWIVASLVQMTGMALDPAGRAVSVVFFLLTLWPAGRILANLRFSISSRLVILSLLLCSPFYIAFLSRTFHDRIARLVPCDLLTRVRVADAPGGPPPGGWLRPPS